LSIPRAQRLLCWPWKPWESLLTFFPPVRSTSLRPRPFHGTAHSRERGLSHQSTCIETGMDRPKSVVRVIKGVASRETINVHSLFVGKFWHVRHPLFQSIRLRLSVFSALLGLAMKSQVYPPSSVRWSKKDQRTYHSRATTVPGFFKISWRLRG